MHLHPHPPTARKRSCPLAHILGVFVRTVLVPKRRHLAASLGATVGSTVIAQVLVHGACAFGARISKGRTVPALRSDRSPRPRSDLRGWTRSGQIDNRDRRVFPRAFARRFAVRVRLRCSSPEHRRKLIKLYGASQKSSNMPISICRTHCCSYQAPDNTSSSSLHVSAGTGTAFVSMAHTTAVDRSPLRRTPPTDQPVSDTYPSHPTHPTWKQCT